MVGGGVLRGGIVAGLAMVLASCATLTKQECLDGDWHTIGYQDGADGRLPDYILRHEETCGRIGVLPDVAAWRAGRAEGLPLYCTPEKAYAIGRMGRDIAPVCSPEALVAMRDAYRLGRVYYHLSDDIAELQQRVRDLDARIGVLEIQADDVDAWRALHELRRARDGLQDAIFDLSVERRRVDLWP